MTAKRKCVVLNKSNMDYIQNLVKTKKVKNFSSGLNDIIESKILDEKFEKSENICHLQNDEFDVRIVKKEGV